MARVNRNAMGLRLGIVAVGVGAGFLLRWLIPPSHDALDGNVLTGTVRSVESSLEDAGKGAAVGAQSQESGEGVSGAGSSVKEPE